MKQLIVQELSGGSQHFSLCDHLCTISACHPDKCEVVSCSFDKIRHLRLCNVTSRAEQEQCSGCGSMETMSLFGKEEAFHFS